MFSQGVIGLVFLYFVSPICLVKALYHWKQRAIFRKELFAAAVYGLAGLAIFGVIRVNAEATRETASGVVRAVEAYYQKEGEYPAALSALVPGYLSSVPKAKRSVMYNAFSYSRSAPDKALLYYVSLPPFGRPCFFFEAGTMRRRYLD